jgi:hypothetical protein
VTQIFSHWSFLQKLHGQHSFIGQHFAELTNFSREQLTSTFALVLLTIFVAAPETEIICSLKIS